MRRRWFILLVIIISFSGLLLWAVGPGRDSAPKLPIAHKKELPNPNPIEINNFSLQEYRPDRLRAKMEADVFKIQSRKFGIFSIRPIREATLIRPKVEIFLLEDNSSSDIDLFPFNMSGQMGGGTGQMGGGTGQGGRFLKDIGVITRVVLDQLELQVYRKGSRLPSLTVSAEHATIHPRHKELRMEGVVIEDRLSNRSIKSSLAVWNNQQKNFVFPGEYLLTTGDGETRGRNIRLDLKLKVAPSRPAPS